MALQFPSALDAPNASLEPLISGYRPLHGVFDEMMDGDGRVRAHWQPFLAMLAALGGDEINRRFAAADRYLRDSGVFYRVYEDAAGLERPWPLSHIPLIIEPGEWRQLEAGLIQRAELLEAVLGGFLRSGDADARRPTAGRIDRRQSGILAAAGRRRAARRRALAFLCRRRRPRRRRPLVGAQRSRPGAVRRRLCDRKPAGAVARHSRHLPQRPRRARRAVLPGFAGRIVRAQPPRRRAHLPAHARTDERNLFRARLSGALSRPSSGRRRRFKRPGRRRLHPHRVGAAPHRSAAAAHRCRFRRSARAQRRLPARRRRAPAGRARRQDRHHQCARRRPGRGARHAGVPAGAGADRARRRAENVECRDLVARPRRHARGDDRQARQHGDRVGLHRATVRMRSSAAKYWAPSSTTRSGPR